MSKRNVLITGVAGFIGFSVAKHLLSTQKDINIIGIDNLNNYYDVQLKQDRLNILQEYNNFQFYKIDLAKDKTAVFDLSKKHNNINYILHLAAQAGVRYSLTNPYAYTETNITGHLNMMELAKQLPELKNFVYASSSSVYGANTKMPFSIEDQVDTPLSLYAATKKSCELMSYCYNHLYNIPMIGLRFFTVYGPWGRPDMSAFIFTKAILNGDKLPVFNNGDMKRNFTYIDDIVSGATSCLFNPSNSGHKVYNIGNNKTEKLLDFIKILEKHLNKKANLEMLPMQPGDVKETVADITATQEDFGFEPSTDIDDGLEKFVNWYQKYYIKSYV